MSLIHFAAKPYTIGSWLILRLPVSASVKLPSRGQVMVKGILNDAHFQTALEPDGSGSHWLHIDRKLQAAAKITAGRPIAVTMESSKDWPEPHLPADLRTALQRHPKVHDLWRRITPLARWEWIRWINATGRAETRSHRIEVACSKLLAGERRPCCFNRNMCCVPQVSKSGVLLGPDEAKLS